LSGEKTNELMTWPDNIAVYFAKQKKVIFV